MDLQEVQKSIQNLNINKNLQVKSTVIYNKNYVNGTCSEQIQKSTKTRRKQRPRKEKQKPKEKEVVPHISFNIQAITEETKSTFIKYRSVINNYVNIHTFLNDVRKSVIFKSPLCNKVQIRNSHEKNFTNIKALENGIKQFKKRKYLNVNLQNQNCSTLKKKSPKKKKRFEQYFTENEINSALLKNELIEGTIRINPKNFKDAYVTNVDENEKDYVINSLYDRNRALEGDVVYLKLKPETEWKENLMTAYVVAIKEKVHNRTAIGYLTISSDRHTPLFIPRDIRIPRMKLQKRDLPLHFYENKKLYEKVLFLAKIVEWKDLKYAEGMILDQLGIENDLAIENKALLLEHNIDISEVPESALGDIANIDQIPVNEIVTREDIRKECVFTIDPLTAKDLDDALSLKELPNGNIEIGVHIADVTYYLHEETYLDKLVSEKATSVYLINKVYHMLPPMLCLHCSLLPEKDSLAFSVFWEFNQEYEIVKHRFARTVIKSCVQLAYEHAQIMIENPNSTFKDDELPHIGNGFTSRTLIKIVNILQKIAVSLRSKRFRNGALRIDQTKLSFTLSPLDQIPIDFSICQLKDANRMIEEFMLLANQTVAQRILEDFPDVAFLRNHKMPYDRILKEVQKSVKKYDVDLEINSGGDIQASLGKIDKNSSNGQNQLVVLNYLLTKAMKRANYICAGTCKDYTHYALSIPTYTHFTSPIRRYADIMVHRLLAASLGYRRKPCWTQDYVSKIAEICNKQKQLAKKAQEASEALYLAYFVGKHQPYITKAVVADVKDRSFEIIILDIGITIRMTTNNLGDNVSCEVVEVDERVYKIYITFEADDNLPSYVQLIELFQVINVSLTRKPKSTKLCAELVRPQTE